MPKSDVDGFHVENAIVSDIRVVLDRGFVLSLWITLEYGSGGVQGFGGYALGGTPGSKVGEHQTGPNHAGEFFVRCMMAMGVEDLMKGVGKAVRVVREDDSFGAMVVGIGHISKDDQWFLPKRTFDKWSGKGA